MREISCVALVVVVRGEWDVFGTPRQAHSDLVIPVFSLWVRNVTFAVFPMERVWSIVCRVRKLQYMCVTLGYTAYCFIVFCTKISATTMVK